MAVKEQATLENCDPVKVQGIQGMVLQSVSSVQFQVHLGTYSHFSGWTFSFRDVGENLHGKVRFLPPNMKPLKMHFFLFRTPARGEAPIVDGHLSLCCRQRGFLTSFSSPSSTTLDEDFLSFFLN